MSNNNYMMTAHDCAVELGCSDAHAYKIIRMMNQELESSGYLVIAGKIPRPYFKKKLYGFQAEEGGC